MLCLIWTCFAGSSNRDEQNIIKKIIIKIFIFRKLNLREQNSISQKTIKNKLPDKPKGLFGAELMLALGDGTLIPDDTDKELERVLLLGEGVANPAGEKLTLWGIAVSGTGV